MKNKTVTIILIIILSLIAIILSVVMIGLINGKNTLFNMNFIHTISNELVIDETYENIYEEINVKADASDIYIKETSNDEIKVIIYGDKDRTEINNNGNKLTIESKSKPCIGICINQKIAKIEVYLPSSYSNSFIVDNKYGDIEVGDFKNSTLKIDENYGDVSVISGDIVSITNDYGDVTLEAANEATVKSAAGNVKIGNVKSINIINNYGDISIDNISNSLEVSEDYGDIKINNINISKDSKIKNSFGDIKVGSTNEIYIKAQTDLGSVKINNNYPKSNITLDIENDCGDITVKN